MLSIDEKLLRMSLQCYWVTADSNEVPPEFLRRFEEIGYQGNIAPVIVEPASSAIDRAVLGIVDGGVALAFRGTLPPIQEGKPDLRIVLNDWINDARAILVDGDAARGEVHHGFWQSFGDVWKTPMPDNGALEDRIIALARAHPARKIFVTGHSKGGPLAVLAAMRLFESLRDNGDNIAIEVVTFAAARVGNAAFKAAFDQTGIVARRYEVNLDIVPLVPPTIRRARFLRMKLAALGLPELPSIEGYVAVGTPIRQKWYDLSVLRDSITSAWRTLRSGHNKTALMALLAGAHSIDPGSAYDKLVSSHNR